MGNWVPAPAIAGDGEGKTIVLTTPSAAAAESETVVAFLADDEREGQRDSAEARGQRDGDGERRGPRDGEREGDNALKGFKPQTQREAALYQMILQLQREMATIRREMQGRRGTRDGDDGQRGPRDGDGDGRGSSTARPANADERKVQNIFQKYDSDGNGKLSAAEFGKIYATGTRASTRYFPTADRNQDGSLSLTEFMDFRLRRRPTVEGEGAGRGPRDGEGGQRGPRDAGAYSGLCPMSRSQVRTG